MMHELRTFYSLVIYNNSSRKTLLYLLVQIFSAMYIYLYYILFILAIFQILSSAGAKVYKDKKLSINTNINQEIGQL